MVCVMSVPAGLVGVALMNSWLGFFVGYSLSLMLWLFVYVRYGEEDEETIERKNADIGRKTANIERLNDEIQRLENKFSYGDPTPQPEVEIAEKLARSLGKEIKVIPAHWEELQIEIVDKEE